MENKKDNLFHTCCLVQTIPCSVVLDSGSSTNVITSSLVWRLDLDTTPHPRPYKLQWLNDCEELKVTKDVKVSIAIGRYKDAVLCDVVPMHAGDILLGRSWEFDRKVIYDGFLNRYTFTHNGRKTILVPLLSHPLLDTLLI